MSLSRNNNSSNNVFLQDNILNALNSPTRFVVESCLATIAVVCNVLALIAAKNARGKHGSYHLLFMNLALANTLTCALLISCNQNVKSSDLLKKLLNNNQCRILVFISSLAFLSSSFNLIAASTLLGFAVIQYLAIGRPLHHQNLVRRRKICIFIGCSWTVTLISSLVPVLLLAYFIGSEKTCNLITAIHKTSKIIRIATNVYTAILAFIYISIIILCCRVYSTIQRLQKRLSQYRQDQQSSNEVKGEKSAFITIILLLVTLTICFFPYTICYLITLNSSDDVAFDNTVVIYLMNFLPYVKITLDPYIYGMRMKEVKDSCERMLIVCGLHKCFPCLKPTSSVIAIPLQHTTVACHTTAL